MSSLRVVVALVALGSLPAGAQVYEWRDPSGSRHFTNDLEGIPDAQREGARVVVRAEPVRQADPAATDADAEESPRERRRRERRERYAREPVRSAQVVYDNSFRFQRPQAAVPDVYVNIEGPLAVSQVVVPPAPPVPVFLQDPYYDPYYEPLVSTSFDRGRYRHRTVRMRLQDQFQYDRNGPSLYVAGPIPLGPRFQAKLPRGVRSCAVTQRRSVLRR
jgi:hypothetical protein